MNTKDAAPGPSPRAVTAGKLLDILDSLTHADTPLSLVQITTMVGEPKPTTHRLLQTLEERGYAQRTADGTHFTLGPRCINLGTHAQRQLDLISVARPFVEEASLATRETVHLAVYHDGEALYVARQEAPLPVIPKSALGDHLPAHAVATGRVLLAHQDVGEQKRILNEGLANYTGRTLVDPTAMLEELHRVRSNGFAVQRSELRPGVCGVAVPVWSGGGAVIAALGCCVPESRFSAGSVEGMKQVLLRVAGALSVQLGYEPNSETQRAAL